jgi:hypothetical protein
MSEQKGSLRDFLATVDDRIAKVAAIGDDDPEVAHGLEDDLLGDALAAIRDGGDELSAEVARRVLAVGELDFPRWYA